MKKRTYERSLVNEADFKLGRFSRDLIFQCLNSIAKRYFIHEGLGLPLSNKIGSQLKHCVVLNKAQD